MKNPMEFKKPYLDYKDIMEIMGCGRSKAYDYIKAIRSISDVGKTDGRVMVRDFNMWAYGTCEPYKPVTTEFHITPIRRNREVI